MSLLAAILCFAHGGCAVANDPPPLPPLEPALASWYDDAGQTASGWHYANGFASLALGSEWGRRVEFHHAGRTVVGRLDDHGPYVAGRAFDLNARLRGLLACPDLCQLRWRFAR